MFERVHQQNRYSAVPFYVKILLQELKRLIKCNASLMQVFWRYQLSFFLKPMIWPVFKKYLFQKQSSRGVLRKRCSEYMQQIYKRAPVPKCDFNKVALQEEIVRQNF